jgi:hypothetical protein
MKNYTMEDMQRQLRDLLDRDEIANLMQRSTTSFDDRAVDDAWARSVFTDDVELSFPIGSHSGIGGTAAFHRNSTAKWERTLHFTTNYVTSIDGDNATIRANLFAIQIHLAETQRVRGSDADFFVAGEYRGDVLRTPLGWRFRRLEFRVFRTYGEGPFNRASSD